VQTAGAAFASEFQRVFSLVITIDTIASAAAAVAVLFGGHIANGLDLPGGDECGSREEKEG